MKQWIQSRLAWIDGQFLSPPSLSLKEGPVAAGTRLSLDARKGKIFYTLDNTDPRLPGGAVSKTAHLYTGPVEVKEASHLVARAYSGSTWSGPALGAFPVRKTAQSH